MKDEDDGSVSAACDRLSDIGSMGKNTKAKVGEAIGILKKSIDKVAHDKKQCATLKKYLQTLQSLKSGKDSVDSYKVKIIEAMQAVRKAGA